MNILIINRNQFGYSAGYFFYCKYLLNKGYNITFYCYDHGLKKMELPGIKIKYLQHSKTLINKINFFLGLKKIKIKEFDSIILTHHRFSFLFRFFGLPYKSILDIRTGDLIAKGFLKKIMDISYRFDTIFFQKITILSESLRDQLKLNPNKCTILPLGAISFSEAKKSYNNLKLLYVGTLNNRRIKDTIYGIKIFLNRFPEEIISYDIIGFGKKFEEEEIVKSIQECNLSEQVTFHGRKNYSELSSFFEVATIGVSYIPITKAFNIQPPTKTFEYALSGLFTIATSTFENSRLIDTKNGILISDNEKAFAEALEIISSKKLLISEENIRKSLENYHWSKIVDNILEKIITT